jgi:hypothetical protein
MSSSVSRPDGWVDHPVIPITRRAIFAGVAITVLAVVTAFASIYARRARLELTTEFWGPDTILALQHAPRVILHLWPTPATEGGGDGSGHVLQQPQTVDLSGTPGLGHLRHALLDQRHYEWETRMAKPAHRIDAAGGYFATLTFSDPRGRVPTGSIDLELNEGWVGPPDRQERVRLIARARPAVRHFLEVVRNAQQAHYDNR